MNKAAGEWTPRLHMFGMKVLSKKGVQTHYDIDKASKVSHQSQCIFTVTVYGCAGANKETNNVSNDVNVNDNVEQSTVVDGSDYDDEEGGVGEGGGNSMLRKQQQVLAVINKP